MNPAEEILEQLIDELASLPGYDDPMLKSHCPMKNHLGQPCERCSVVVLVREDVERALARLERLRLGIGTVAA